MAKARLFVDRNVASGNLWNCAAATLSGSSAVSALPWTNTQNPERTTIARSATGTGEAYIDIDLGAGYASYPVTAIAVANVKLLGAGVLKLQERGTSGSPGSATDVVTLPSQDAQRRIAYAYPAATVTKRHYRLLFTNPTSASDYAELGYVFLGSHFEPGVNFSAPADVGYEDPSQERRSDGGQKTMVARATYYEGKCLFREMLDADFDAMEACYALVTGGLPFFQILDATRARLNALVRITGGLAVPVTTSPGRSSCEYAWEEAL